EATGVCTADRLVEPVVHALECLAVLVDEHVVADVAPVEVARVVGVDAPHDLGGFAGGVVVRAGAVVDGRRGAVVVDGLPAAAVAAVHAPRGPGNDRRTALDVLELAGLCGVRCGGGVRGEQDRPEVGVDEV